MNSPQFKVSWVRSEFVSTSAKIQSVTSISDASVFHQKGTTWRKLLDSSLYDLAKLIASKCPYFMEPNSEPYRAYFNQCFEAWCASFHSFDTMRSSMIEYSHTRQLSFLAYMKQNVNKTLISIRKKRAGQL